MPSHKLLLLNSEKNYFLILLFHHFCHFIIWPHSYITLIRTCRRSTKIDNDYKFISTTINTTTVCSIQNDIYYSRGFGLQFLIINYSKFVTYLCSLCILEGGKFSLISYFFPFCYILDRLLEIYTKLSSTYVHVQHQHKLFNISQTYCYTDV